MTSGRLAALAAMFVLACGAGFGMACGSDQTTAPGDDASGDDAATSDGTVGDDGGDGTSGDVGVDGAADATTGDDADADTDTGGGGDGGVDACFAGCPPTQQCGHYTDPCTGTTYTCGSTCPKGKVCTGPNGSQTCQTPSCNGQCGVIGKDSCGIPISCGGCPTGQSCVNNQCVPSMPQDAGTCTPLTCTSYGQSLCGTVSDGCGHTMDCSCPSGQQCYGGICSTLPPECDGDAGMKCGVVQNACGSGYVNCGNNCTGTTKCVAGTCTPCTPPSCGTAVCGNLNNGCGPTVHCGTCVTGEACDDGGCCTPLTCADAIDAGLVTGCGPVDLGCGIKKSCAPCMAGEICQNETCTPCVAKTCADFDDAGCGHSDGCGGTLNCCGAGLLCAGGGLCCPPEQIVYNGSCCQPACDPKLPPGPQVSCGVTLICNG